MIWAEPWTMEPGPAVDAVLGDALEVLRIVAILIAPAMPATAVEVWRRIATRCKDAKAIWGYDLANEPVEDEAEDGCDDWQALAERAARAVRARRPFCP